MRRVTGLTLGQHWPFDFPIHLLDPRTKIVCSLILLTGVFMTDAPIQGLPIFVFLIGGFRIAAIPVGQVVRVIRPFLWLFCFAVALHVLGSLGSGGTPLWPDGPKLSTSELNKGVLVEVRLLLALLIASLLMLTTTPNRLSLGIEYLIRPLRRIGVPVDDLGLMIALTVRFLPIFMEELDRIIMAQTSRGWVLNRDGPVQRVRNVLPILIPLLTGVIERAESVVVALHCRGYRPGLNRQRYGINPFGTADLGALAACAVLAFLMACWNQVLQFP